MLESDAKTKWCPHVRVYDSDTVRNCTAHVRNLPEARCIGSACMMWEPMLYGKTPYWVHPNALKDHWQGWTVTNSTPDRRGYVEITPPYSEPEGDCGLKAKECNCGNS